MFFSSLFFYFRNKSCFYFNSYETFGNSFQDVNFLQRFGFFYRRPLLQSYKLDAFNSAIYFKPYFFKGKSLSMAKDTGFFRSKFVAWRYRVRGFFRRGRLKLLLRYRFLRRKRFRLAFPGVGARALYFRKKHHMLYFSLVLGTYKKAFSSVLGYSSLRSSLLNIWVNSSVFYYMVELFCNYGRRNKVFWGNKELCRSE